MQNSWIVLVPPILVLALAVITKRVLSSLFIGIVTAGLIVSQFSLLKTLSLLIARFWQQVYDATNFYTFSFLLILGILITLMANSGGTAAYGKLIKKLLRTARSAKLSSIVLSLLFMIDDFFSTLTVGCIMRPLTDTFRIPRAKLAFLVDSLAAPLVILLPISTWIAMLLMQLNKGGISLDPSDAPIVAADPFVTYLTVLPFIFYSFIILASVWFIVYHAISFGLMRNHELIAQKTGNVFGGKAPIESMVQEPCDKEGSVIDFLLPIGSLIVFTGLGILYTGNSTLFGGTHALLQTMQHADIFFALFAGGLSALIFNCIHMMLRKRLTWKNYPSLIRGGWSLMASSIAILFFAWTFSTMLKDDLQTGNYIAQLLVGSVSAALLPAMFFIAALMTAIATGSSWGTFAVLIPIAIPMLAEFFHVAIPASPEAIPLLYPVIGAIFAGGVAGDHVSPIAATTVMSATSAGCYLNDHVYTQLSYAAPALIATTIAYLAVGILAPYGLWFSALISLGIGLFIALFSLYLINYWYQKKNKETL
jgi:tetracycline resistance efflux pump